MSNWQRVKLWWLILWTGQDLESFRKQISGNVWERLSRWDRKTYFNWEKSHSIGWCPGLDKEKKWARASIVFLLPDYSRYNVTSSLLLLTLLQDHDRLPLKLWAKINPFFVSLIRVFYHKDRTNREYTWVVSTLWWRWITLSWVLIYKLPCGELSVSLGSGCWEGLLGCMETCTLKTQDQD